MAIENAIYLYHGWWQKQEENIGVEKRYYWKELLSDGLLVEPEDVGPYWNLQSFNIHGGYVSEDEAIQALNRLRKQCGYTNVSGLMLITMYAVCSC